MFRGWKDETWKNIWLLFQAEICGESHLTRACSTPTAFPPRRCPTGILVIAGATLSPAIVGEIGGQHGHGTVTKKLSKTNLKSIQAAFQHGILPEQNAQMPTKGPHGFKKLKLKRWGSHVYQVGSISLLRVASKQKWLLFYQQLFSICVGSTATNDICGSCVYIFIYTYIYIYYVLVRCSSSLWQNCITLGFPGRADRACWLHGSIVMKLQFTDSSWGKGPGNYWKLSEVTTANMAIAFRRIQLSAKRTEDARQAYPFTSYLR